MTLLKRPSTAQANSDQEVKVGDWVWVRTANEDDEPIRWLGCIMHIGSNFVLVDGVEGYSKRVHFQDFWTVCEPESKYHEVIHEHREIAQREVQRVMREIQAVAARLALTSAPSLVEAGAQQTQALTRYTGDYGDYKSALVKAKKGDLPSLFNQLRRANEWLAEWVKADTLPLQAQALDLHELTQAIDDRIFHIDLYAGLSEQLVQLRGGEPAPIDAKLHLMQRRHYMDEECLARYESGGMEFEDIAAFDQWLLRPANLDRLLPHPRCVLSFQVRRHYKEQNFGSITEFISFMFGGESGDQKTFLYLRNGEQVYRLDTTIEFGEQLFPDLNASRLDEGQLWAKVWRRQGVRAHVEQLISDNTRESMRERYEQKLQKHREEVAERRRLREAGLSETMPSGPWDWEPDDPLRDYVPFNHSTVYYDDIQRALQDQITAHNHVVLILQGLLDRSPVFQPHPPWQLWEPDGFQSALTLVYDSRALPAGEAPDFLAYWAECNRTLKTGCVTVGQQVEWEKRMAHKENERANAHGWGSHKRYRPFGNPGPGKFARATKITRTGKATFEWTRERRQYPFDQIATKATFDSGVLFNVDGYRPGDYRQFFDDPRTRADYLKWAPFLLAAEDYHAGKVTLVGEPDQIGDFELDEWPPVRGKASSD